ncbi:MAG: tyrosine-type recombinase/integrase [Prevotella sp.]|nr:tyrosine-type recombinase/integrase [Prevotella sp.]
MIDKFLEYLQLERNYSPKTVLSYGKDLNAFESYFKNLNDELTWESVDSDVIRDWMESMMDKGNNATSINRRLSALRSFYRFALTRHFVDHNPAHYIQGPKKEKPLPKFIKEADMDRLMEPEMWGNSFVDIRARTIILTLYTTGIREAELVGLDDQSIDFVNSQMKVTGKRNKQRVIPFGKELAEELRRYIAIRDEQIPRQTTALFVSNKGLRIPPKNIDPIVRKGLGKVTTQKKRSPHVLRHSFATAMLNHDAGIESVQKLLGHDSLTSTEIYTHTTFEQLKRVYKNTHPRG